MIHQFHRIFVAALAACAFTLVSCGDNAVFSDSEKRTFTQEIYVVPESITGAVHLFYSPKKEVFLNINENIKIQAVFRRNGEVLDADEAVNYYQSLLWRINEKKINIPTFRFSFTESGQYDCILQTVDSFGDTLTDTTIIYVDSPSSVTLTSPRDGYNMIDPFAEQEIPLQWTATGIDPWESAQCTIYGSNKKESLWKKPLGSSDCVEKTSIIGPIVPDRETLESYGIYLEEESVTFYWGVIMTVSNSKGVQAVDTSNVFRFSTRLVDADSSILNIPIEYKSFYTPLVPDTRITIKDASGKTLKEIEHAQAHSTISTKLVPQTGVMVYFQELYYDEYKAESLKVDIPERSVVNLDTVFFEDNIAPTIWPLSSKVPIGEPIVFSILDKGSGISISKIQVHYEETNPVHYTFSEPLLSIITDSHKDRRIYIQITDNAGNTSAPVYWEAKARSDTFFISGPYIHKEELE